MKKIDQFIREITTQLQWDFKQISPSNLEWKKEIGDIEISLDIQKSAKIFQLIISKNEPHLLDGKYPCKLRKIIKRLELAEGKNKSYVWFDSLDHENPYEEFVLIKNTKYWKVPSPTMINYHTNEDVVELLQQEVINALKSK